MGEKFLVSDCDGPLSLNDNAFELAGHFLPPGEKFFQIVSQYDDVLVEMKRPGGLQKGEVLESLCREN